MAKRTARRYGPDASRFENLGRVLDELAPPRCAWFDCNVPAFDELPVCYTHAMAIYQYVNVGLRAPRTGPLRSRPEPQAYVYYLMLSPTMVKIGTTRSLSQRVNALRSELQYVVAIERGGRDLEHQRHQEFAEERRNSRREDFHLSDRLKKHIDELAPQRDELIKQAIAY